MFSRVFLKQTEQLKEENTRAKKRQLCKSVTEGIENYCYKNLSVYKEEPLNLSLGPFLRL